jgi:hypothetical protein
MRLFLDCYPCLLRQALAAGRLCALVEKDILSILEEVMRDLLESGMQASPQSITTALYAFMHRRFFREHSVFDPYAHLKQDSTAAVMERFDFLERQVLEADAPLEVAVKSAAAGNVIDFGALDYRSIDIDRELHGIPALRFSVYNYEPLLDMMGTARRLLYIGDNAGEIVLDRILIRQIKRMYPGIRIHLATRHAPILNDITIADAEQAGVTEDAMVFSSGCSYPGTVLAATSAEFQARFREADVIIAKGQGNYEGLWDVEDRRLFFLLRVKCERIAESIGAPMGSLVLRQKTACAM